LLLLLTQRLPHKELDEDMVALGCRDVCHKLGPTRRLLCPGRQPPEEFGVARELVDSGGTPEGDH